MLIRLLLITLVSACSVHRTPQSLVSDADTDAVVETDAAEDVVELHDAAGDARVEIDAHVDADAASDATLDAFVGDAADGSYATDASEDATADAAEDAAWIIDAAVDAEVIVDAGSDTGAGGVGGTSGSGGTGGDVDAGCLMRTYYRDEDRDAYGDPATAVTGCRSPGGSGWITRTGDCYDDNANAKPGQTMSFTDDRGDGSYDFNCDGVETKIYTAISPCHGPDGVGGPIGWKEICLESANGMCIRFQGVPACGVRADWIFETNACPAQWVATQQRCR